MAKLFGKIAVLSALLGAAALAASAPVEARPGAKAKGKAKAAYATAGHKRAAVRARGDGGQEFAGTFGLRDRTTINFPNGKLNGQELFDSIADRAADGGQ